MTQKYTHNDAHTLNLSKLHTLTHKVTQTQRQIYKDTLTQKHIRDQTEKTHKQDHTQKNTNKNTDKETHNDIYTHNDAHNDTHTR